MDIEEDIMYGKKKIEERRGEYGKEVYVLKKELEEVTDKMMQFEKEMKRFQKEAK